MPIAWNSTYYPDLPALIAALPPCPPWAAGLTLHHTYRPTVAEWRGLRSMQALGRFYAAKGWPAGPHLFVAPDGIWGGTPLTTQGVHAGQCNATRIGIEIVGDYDAAPWPPDLQARVIALSVALLHWLRAEESTVWGHRECLPNKSCPGRAIHLPLVREWIGAQLFTRKFTTIANMSNVRQVARVTSAVLAQVPAGSVFSAHPVRGTFVRGSNTWVRVRLPSGRLGYIWQQLGVLA